MAKMNFQQPSIQSSVSHDPSDPFFDEQNIQKNILYYKSFVIL